MKDTIKDYKEKLEKSLASYMAMPVSQRSAEAVRSMVDCWEHISEMEKQCHCSIEFTEAEAKKWVESMKNEDGTTGGHWTMDETSAVGVPDNISNYCWYAAMNMIYSDYSKVAEKYNLNVPEFYADMAEAFLLDKDATSPHEKLAGYYNCIVTKE